MICATLGATQRVDHHIIKDLHMPPCVADDCEVRQGD